MKEIFLLLTSDLMLEVEFFWKN